MSTTQTDKLQQGANTFVKALMTEGRMLDVHKLDTEREKIQRREKRRREHAEQLEKDSADESAIEAVYDELDELAAQLLTIGYKRAAAYLEREGTGEPAQPDEIDFNAAAEFLGWTGGDDADESEPDPTPSSGEESASTSGAESVSPDTAS